MTVGRPPTISTESLLDSACRTFVTRGYAEAHMAAIAADAGVTKPTIYARLGGKEEVFARVVDREARRLGDHLLRRYAAAAGAGPAEAVSIATDALFDYCAEERDSFLLLFSSRLGGPALDRDALVLERVRGGILDLIRARRPDPDPTPPGVLQVLAALVVDIAIRCARSAIEGDDLGLDHARQLCRATTTTLLLRDDPAVWSR